MYERLKSQIELTLNWPRIRGGKNYSYTEAAANANRLIDLGKRFAAEA
jgi:hypothetical protein